METRLIVGLGNHGREYERTRHNAGFLVVEEWARRVGVDFSENRRMDGWVAEWRKGDKKWIALKPATYMNLSGRSVVAALNFWKLEVKSMLVVVDDVELPLGELRLRSSGGDGGHNGLKSIITGVGKTDFCRLRMGVGRPPTGLPVDLADWVLGKFEKSELICFEDSIRTAVSAIAVWGEDGVVKAMNRFNGTGSRPLSSSCGAPKK